MDPVILAGMIFSLVVLLMIGGFILMFPLTRRLAQLLEQRLREKSTAAADSEQIAALRTTIDALEARVEALTERQGFVDSLLERPQPSRRTVPGPEIQAPSRQ